MDNNPSPGNKKGGLTTILEKSLGAVAKGGTAPLTQVYRFAEPITERGFVFMDSPGYDPTSVTGQIASGANLIAFTTGRGSVSGYKPTPCIKLATNTEMYDRMSEDMDINCGDIITEGVTLEQKGREIFELFLRVASGEETKSEELGFGGAEFEFGNFSRRIKRRIGQQIGGGLRVAEGQEDHAPRYIPIFADTRGHRPTPGFDSNLIARPCTHMGDLGRVHLSNGFGFELVENCGAPRHGARVPMFEHAACR
jgi:hypothetical protein